MAIFEKGDKVEVCSKEQGFLGSYYEATVINPLDGGEYQVQYKNLVTDDMSQPLIETITAEELRPLPPLMRRPNEFWGTEEVDVFDNDGWWVGTVVGRQEKRYKVYFASSDETLWFPIFKLRRHLNWCNGKWFCSNKRAAEPETQLEYLIIQKNANHSCQN
ncbi:hypothetical protein SLA2020_101470 [Shorea laevis]